ncbi:AraC family transcriptional regulator [Marinomonas sp. 42_23_T18]|nr:AraC family transcriptional regulator [Marinomonas sp. 42_23_T18]
MSHQDTWVQLEQDKQTGIETFRAHLTGRAYDPHWHDTYLIGFTEQGVQQFNCRKAMRTSLAGGSFLLEPGEIHDGNAPLEGGFTYRQLYLPVAWLHQSLASLFHHLPDNFEFNTAQNLMQDKQLTASISAAFSALHYQEPEIIREACLDQMLEHASKHLSWRKKADQDLLLSNPIPCSLALKTREFLRQNIHQDISLESLASDLGTDRFRLTRRFKAAFGMAPHAYLIQLRLAKARALLALGLSPIQVASELCFSDQSHLGRWFRRAYRLTPSAYQKQIVKGIC